MIDPRDQIERTPGGWWCGWEHGSGLTHKGKALVWTRADGSKPYAIWMRRRTIRQALIPLKPGMWAISYKFWAYRSGVSGIAIEICRVESVPRNRKEEGPEEGVPELRLIYSLNGEEWDTPPGVPPDFLKPAIAAARGKAHDYHGREIWWALEGYGAGGKVQAKSDLDDPPWIMERGPIEQIP